jgi:hypothetical protein
MVAPLGFSLHSQSTRVMDSSASLSNLLSELFCEDVSYDVLQQQQIGGAAVLFIEMRYRTEASSQHSQRIRQTAVVLRDPELDLPQFAIWPHHTGLVGMLAGRLSGMGDIDFQDDRQFSDDYHLHGWNEAAVRALFTPSLRDCFSRYPGWSGRGVRNHAIVFKQNRVVSEDQATGFLDQALELLEGIQRGEEELDERPGLRRQADLSDVVESLRTGGGLQASIMLHALRRDQITPDQMRAFQEQPTPRRQIPAGLRRQVIGDNLMLAVLGGVFLVVGTVLAIMMAVFAPPADRWIAIPFGVVFPLVGAPMLFFTLRYRGKKKRLLREGSLVDGTLASVNRTNVKVNDATRYKIRVQYELDGRPQSQFINLYANVDKARQLASTGQPVKLLVDPDQPSNLVCLDTLLVFE